MQSRKKLHIRVFCTIYRARKLHASCFVPIVYKEGLIPLSANPTKWLNTFKQFVGSCLSVFDHFVELALKELELKVLDMKNIFVENSSRKMGSIIRNTEISDVFINIKTRRCIVE